MICEKCGQNFSRLLMAREKYYCLECSKGSNDKIPTFETEGLNPNDIKKVVQLRSDLHKMRLMVLRYNLKPLRYY